MQIGAFEKKEDAMSAINMWSETTGKPAILLYNEMVIITC